jgi:hypothetical protein
MFRRRCRPLRIFVAVSTLIAGCAAFEPGVRLHDLQRPRQPTVRESREGLEVSVEEFVSHAKSRMVFDNDLAANGVAALLLRIQNNGTIRYVARRENVRAWLGDQQLTALTPTEAANQAATSEYVGKALGWTLAAGPLAILLWPVTIGASTVHTHGVNRRVEQYFTAGAFQDALVGSKQTALGFVYFKIPGGTMATERFRLQMEIERETGDQRLAYEFDLPVVKLTE